jgi:hypothetical protein
MSEGKSFTPSGFHVVNSEDGKVTLTEAHFRELQSNLESLHMNLAQKNDEIQILQGDVARMRSLSRALLEAGTSDKTTVEADLDTVVQGIRLEDDEAYFSSYAHFGIHHEMLSVRIIVYLLSGIVSNQIFWTNAFFRTGSERKHIAIPSSKTKLK